MDSKAQNNRTLNHLDALAQVMDAQFRVPGTSMRFGLDAIIGLIPGVGDVSGMVVSGYIILVLAANGASGYVIARITFNALIDAAIGSIPVAGDIFDFAFKANQRNMKLVREHYTEDKHQGSAWKVVLPLLLLFLLVCAGIIWMIFGLVSGLIQYVQHWF